MRVKSGVSTVWLLCVLTLGRRVALGPPKELISEVILAFRLLNQVV